MLNIIIFGPPGSGKGTQSAFLVEKYNLQHLSTGDMLRQEIADNTELGKSVKLIMESGKLVSDDVVIKMIGNRIAQKPANTQGFIFDGFPRTVQQAQALDNLLQTQNLKIAAVLLLQVSEEAIIERLLLRAKAQGRTDDTPEIIKARLKEYHDKTAPVAEYYTQQNKAHYIGGNKSINVISKEIFDIIDNAL